MSTTARYALGPLMASLFAPATAWASSSSVTSLDLTAHSVGYAAVIVFVLAYMVVMAEEFTHLRKSKPVLLAAGIIWGMIAWVYARNGFTHAVEEAVRHNILEFAELFLFLLVAMTYIDAMDERQVFKVLRVRLVNAGYSFRQLFWVTGLLAFFISPVADNLTTALLMCAVVMAIGKDNVRFIGLACINIVVAANAGGAFSPFGDITTLMVWQKGIIDFWTFFTLFVPSAVNWLVPAALMSLAIPRENPPPIAEKVEMKRGGKVVMALFGLTICTAVGFHNFLHLPPTVGMMMGLSYLKFYGFYLKKTHRTRRKKAPYVFDPEKAEEQLGDPGLKKLSAFDIFQRMAKAEWDTLMFFYGVILCVGGLGFIGYLATISRVMYIEWGPTPANIVVGVLSAIVDNIPVMFAVLTMNPEMSQGQWLLVTLTAGVGGSLLSIGSAAGVALMGQARGRYTFFGHLKWAPVIGLGYVASIVAHFVVNSGRFH